MKLTLIIFYLIHCTHSISTCKYYIKIVIHWIFYFLFFVLRLQNPVCFLFSWHNFHCQYSLTWPVAALWDSTAPDAKSSLASGEIDIRQKEESRQYQEKGW